MHRQIEPEWLDQLPANDPAAIGSRRDLERINRVMGNAAILSRLLQSTADAPPRRIVELGAGDGRFMLRLARALSPRWRKVQAVLIDNKDAVGADTRAEFKALGWTVVTVTADVFDWLRRPSPELMDAIVANLFLHHFTETQLSEMLGLVAGRTRLFAACEPRRSRVARAFSAMTGVIGCNAVTRHDAAVSVRAGFANDELSRFWPAGSGWRLNEQSAGLFTHAFVATRTSPA